MDLIERITLGNINNGDSISYTPNGSSVPKGFLNKIENTRAKTVTLNEDETGVVEYLIDCQTQDIQLDGEMNLKQLEDYIRQLNVLYKYLKNKGE